MTPTVIILRGVSGAGKSSLAEILEAQGFVVVSADNFFVKDGAYDFDRTKLTKAHHWCYDQYTKALEAGLNVVVDNTNTTEAEVNRYLEKAVYFGYTVRVVTVENWSQTDSIHNVPQDIREAQAKRLRGSIRLK